MLYLHMYFHIDMYTYVYTFVCMHACNNNNPRRKGYQFKSMGDGMSSKKDSWERLERENRQENTL